VLIQPGEIIAGKYRLERALAKGGMGSVWVATQVQLDRLVALKFMDPTLAATSDGRARFDREAKAAAQLESAHVVHVHDYGVSSGVPYIAMELLKGEDLGGRLKRQSRLPLQVAAVILTQVAKALHRAHEAGIIHRDLKPANIFLARQDDAEVVKVLDFGIAKAAGISATESTRTGMVMGSVHYMSPEQARGSKQLDSRTDLWSLGVVAFRMVTGQLPFPGDELGDVIVKTCSDPIPVPSTIAPDLGPEVDKFFFRALSRTPAERFQSARELASAFTALGQLSMGTSSSAWSQPNLARPVFDSLPNGANQEPLPGEVTALLESAPTLAMAPLAQAQPLLANAPAATAPIEAVSASHGTLTGSPRVDDVRSTAMSSRSVRHRVRWIVLAAAASLILLGVFLLFRQDLFHLGGPRLASGTSLIPTGEQASAESPVPSAVPTAAVSAPSVAALGVADPALADAPPDLKPAASAVHSAELSASASPTSIHHPPAVSTGDLGGSHREVTVAKPKAAPKSTANTVLGF
jgi:serine/threonine-protein kinase